jgi:hypothetical protein
MPGPGCKKETICVFAVKFDFPLKQKLKTGDCWRVRSNQSMNVKKLQKNENYY